MYLTSLSKKPFCFTAILLAVCMILPLFSSLDASANIPSRRTLRIGLNYGSTALAASNLVNADGSGFEFGYYDSDLNFTAVASTTEKQISVMVDRNLRWNSGGSFSGQYELAGSDGLSQPAGGASAVGFAHVQLNSGRTTLKQAQSDIAPYSDGFVRYVAGSSAPFVPMFGSFTSSTAANAAKGSGTVNTGTALTITVSAMGTSRVLFEYDNTNSRTLIFGIRPMNHAKPVTHYRGERYNGGFRYERRSATALTVVNIVGLEDYVAGVIPYEMGAGWPLEALKAQAICARTYALAQLNKHHNSNNFDLCNTADCQVYRGRAATNANTDNAAASTAGKVVTHNGSLISTYYSSSHGGGSENNENIWAGTAMPYLRGVLDNYEDAVASSISQYNWTLSVSQADITARVRNAGYSGASTIVSLQVSQYSPTGNAISVIAKDSNGKSYTFSRRSGLQALFGASALRSQRFNIGTVAWAPGNSLFVNSGQTVDSSEFNVITDTGTSIVTGSVIAIDGSNNKVTVTGGGGAGISAGTATGPVNGNFVLSGKGWGHSVGMSQWGAYSQAKHYNRTAEQIIKHYFTGVSIVNG